MHVLCGKRLITADYEHACANQGPLPGNQGTRAGGANILPVPHHLPACVKVFGGSAAQLSVDPPLGGIHRRTVLRATRSRDHFVLSGTFWAAVHLPCQAPLRARLGPQTLLLAERQAFGSSCA